MLHGQRLPRSLLLLLLALIPLSVLADPATLPFTDCFSDHDAQDQKLNINTVYGQILPSEQWGHYLNLTLIGDSPKQIVGIIGNSSSLATLFTTTSILTLNAFTNSSYVCNTIRPPSPLPALNSDPQQTPAPTYCPIAAGPFALSSTIPLGNNRALTTLSTRLRAVDSLGNELVCIDVLTSPLNPDPGNPYGIAIIIFWGTVGLTILYWLVVGTARIVAAWGRGLSRRGIWARVESAGFILASAISGERLAASPALMRFCTPSMRDIMFHTQWCAILAMVAVQWPSFAYPVLSQTAWAVLQYNITLIPSSASHHWNPLSTLPFNPPSTFSDQLADPNSPLYINSTATNLLFTLPQNASDGIESFAYALGVRPRDLFPNCLIVFLGIAAAVIAVSCLIWAVDLFSSIVAGKVGGGSGGGAYGERSLGVSTLSRTKSPVGTTTAKDGEIGTPSPQPEEGKSLTGQASFPSSAGHRSRFALPLTSPNPNSERGINSHRPWWRVRTDISSFHSSVLHGNLVRLLVLFHLPLTVFSAYQMTRPRGPDAPLSSIVLAALSFTFLSVLLPLHLVMRVRFTNTNKLFDETRTLLSYGPLYNHYRHGSQMFAGLFFCTNLAFGIVIGAGQKSGTAQAVVILVVEVISALVTSIWLPWGSGASMGLISFLFCVARIVVAVLLVILTPAISIGAGAGGWVAYGILVILALVYLALLLMLVVKLIEALVRIIGGIGFDRSKHVVDAGLLGACGLLGCCGGPRKRRHRRKSKKPESDTINLQHQPASGRNSESSYIPPGAPGFLSAGSRKGSTHSNQPPSVLRPELVNRPYKEDSEDEGFIMGAWQRFPRSAGYAPVGADSSPVTSQSPLKPASGFSRVGGGRAHIDSPYAINAAGNTMGVVGGGVGNASTHTFPSLGQQSGTITAPAFYEDDDDPPPSLSSVARQPEIGTLPPGAMHPAHVRTKSQTAIIEDAGAFASITSPTSTAGRQHKVSSSSMAVAANASPIASTSGGSSNPLLKSSTGSKFMLGGNNSTVGHGNDDDDDDDDDESSQQPRKKAWFPFRRSRPQSSEGRQQQQQSPPVDVEFGGLSGEGGGMSQPQRSFVVIRKPQPQGGSMSRLNQGS